MSTKNPVCGWDFTVRAEGIEVEQVISFMTEYCKRWCFQKEKGEETGYEHYQCRVSMKVKVRDTGMNKLLVKAFNVFCKPTPTVVDTFATQDDFYVMKEDTRIDGPWSDKDTAKTYIPVDMRGEFKPNEVQERLLQIMETTPNRRHVHCVVARGNIGKSYFAVWAHVQGLANYVPFFTEARDFMRMVHGMPRRKTYIIDLPRALSHKAENEVYGAIEQLKTGVIYEDRYHFRMEVIDPVHVIVYTNRMPNMELLSADRWKIWAIPDDFVVSGIPAGS